jgi:hypothetical protein
MSVYFIRAGETDFVKIGTAVSPQGRLASLQIGHYETLTMIREMPGGHAEETWLHRHYRDRHVRGEWHRYCPSMLTVQVVATECAVFQRPPVEPTLAKAIKAAGGTVKVAEACGITPQAVSQWEMCPTRHVHRVASMGRVSARKLRPDMFGEAAPANADEAA